MASDRSLTRLGAAELVRLLRRREISAREIVSSAIETIDAADGEIHAFVTLDRTGALCAAEAIDRRIAEGDDPGPLAGVPVGIKDLLSTAGLRTTFGSLHYARQVPDEDDIAVARLRSAGAIVIGKTNTSEFGYGAVPRNLLFAATRNPWNPALSPGGSSAGSAAAVAARMVPLALGSDGGGSIRVPAALTGIVGFKPSWGRIPVYPGCRNAGMPGASGWESLEHIGPMGRSVDDVALAFTAMTGPDPRDRFSLPNDPKAPIIPDTAGTLRIAYSGDQGFAAVDPEVAAICERAIVGFGKVIGATVAFATPQTGDIQPIFEALVALDTDREGLKAMRETSGLAFGPELSRLLDTGWTADRFTAAIMGRKRAAGEMARFFADWDILATPATAAAAFPIELDHPATIAGRRVGAAGLAPFAAIANLTGQPAISLPAGITSDGRPVGLQLIGRHLADLTLLSVASAFEAATAFPVLLDKSAGARQSSKY